MLAGKHFSRATEAGHDFVEDEVDARIIAPLAQFCEHSDRPGAHFIDALDEWLDDHTGDIRRW